MTKEYKQYLKSLSHKELEYTLMINKKAYGIEPPIEYKLKLIWKKILNTLYGITK